MRKIILFLASLLPSKLPRNAEQAEAWVTSILELAGISEPTRAQRYGVYMMLFHLKEKSNGYARMSMPKRYFVTHVARSLANESAFNKVQEIQAAEKQDKADAAAKEAAEKSTAEYKAKLAVVPNEQG